jgi:hypothetical protein
MIDFMDAAFSGTGVGAVLGFLRVWQHQRHEFLLSTQKTHMDAMASARESKNKYYVFARRTIAIIIVSYFFIVPLVIALLGFNTYVSYEESNGVFLALFKGDYTVTWKVFPPAYIITPIHIYALTQTLTLYFVGRERL